MERTEQVGAFIDFETGKRIDWTCNPEVFADSDSAEFKRVSIPGMSGPKHQFSCGGVRSLSFVLRLHYGIDKEVDTAIKTLRAWLYGDYQKGRLKKGPHRILVSFGKNWPNEKWIVMQVDVTGKTYDKELNCIAADVSITLEEFTIKSRGRKEVIG